jgi:hypothetical protein
MAGDARKHIDMPHTEAICSPIVSAVLDEVCQSFEVDDQAEA